MDLTHLAIELLDRLPANATLGVTVVSAVDGTGVVQLPVTSPVTNVIGALHSSGVTALADAAALAAVLSAMPDEATARRVQPLGTRAEIAFHRPVRALATARCVLTEAALSSLRMLVTGETDRAVFSTIADVDGEAQEGAATGTFDWTVRLAGQRS